MAYVINPHHHTSHPHPQQQIMSTNRNSRYPVLDSALCDLNQHGRVDRGVIYSFVAALHGVCGNFTPVFLYRTRQFHDKVKFIFTTDNSRQSGSFEVLLTAFTDSVNGSYTNPNFFVIVFLSLFRASFIFLHSHFT